MGTIQVPPMPETKPALAKETTTKTLPKTESNTSKSKALEGIICVIVIILFITASAFFFSETKITNAEFLTINFMPLLNHLISINFALFLITISIAAAFILFVGRKQDFWFGTMLITLAYCIAAAISIIGFELTDFFIPILFGLIAMPFGIKFLKEKEQELKYFPRVRSGASAAGRMVLVISIGFLVSLAIIGIVNQPTIEKNFVGETLKMTVGDGITLDDSFLNSLTGVLIDSQVQTVNMIKNWNEVKNLENKNDLDGLMLVQKLDAMKAGLQSKTTQEQMVEQMKGKKIDYGSQIMEKMPIMKEYAKYAWIMYAISAFVIIIAIGNLIVKNLSAVIYSMILFILPETQKTEQNQKK